MKPKHIFWKRILTYCLVLSMILSNFNVSFAQTVNDNNTQSDTVLDESSQSEESEIEPTQEVDPEPTEDIGFENEDTQTSEATDIPSEDPIEPSNTIAEQSVSEMQGEGTEESPFLITNAEQLKKVEEKLSLLEDAYYSLQNDIDLEGCQWNPIGDSENLFKGHFLGNNHTISNFTISETDNCIGFFCEVYFGEVKDLILKDFNVSGGDTTGGLAGSACNSVISNCDIIGGTINGTWRVGGLIAYCNNSSSVSFCDVNCQVNGTNDVGGITGWLTDGTISNCMFAGKVTASEDSVGGFAGYCQSATIEQSYSNGDIEGADLVAGLLGSTDLFGLGVQLNNCFVLGTVTAEDGSAGGILSVTNTMAYVDNINVKLTNCYCAAELEGTYCYPFGKDGVTATSCYNDIEATKKANSTYQRMDRLTVAMLTKANYVDWDFDTIWDMVEGSSYPYLRGLEKPQECTITRPILSGQGTEEEPYVITDSEQFKIMEVMPDEWYSLQNDLDLNGCEWEPVGTTTNKFTGHFNGNGYTISNFNITENSSESNIGFFGYISNAEISGLTLSDFTVTGYKYVGGIIGYIEGDNANISDCHTLNGSISGTQYIGGLAGYSAGTVTISGCSSNCEVKDGSAAGGIIGSGKVDMSNCAFTGKVNCNSNAIGGLIGVCNGGSFEECYSTGDIVGNNLVGGLIGSNTVSSITVNNCFVLGSVTSTGGSVGGIYCNYYSYGLNLSNSYSGVKITGSTKYAMGPGSPKITNSYFDMEVCGISSTSTSSSQRTTKQLSSTDNYTDWDFENVWDIEEGHSYPYLREMEKPDCVLTDDIMMVGEGTEESPYLIKSVGQLEKMGSLLDAWYSLENNIDLGGTTWTPVGTSSKKFTGHFFGNGYRISNFYIESSSNYVGFFGYATNAEIEDLTLTNFTTKGGSYVGGIVGYAYNSNVNITNCHTLDGTISGSQCVGGIVGYSRAEALISECTSNCDISTTSNKAGGIVGAGKVNMENCAFTNKITCGASYAGGLIGYCEGGTLQKCYSTGEINAKDQAGGLIGDAYLYTTDVSNCFTLGTVQSASGVAGGIFGGSSNSNINITNCYSAAKITGTDAYGIGPNSPVITNSYYDVETNGILSDINQSVNRFKGMMTAKENFIDWDFTEVWDVDTGCSYPYLIGMEKPDEVTFDEPVSSGQGTEESPLQITSAEQLENMNIISDCWYILNEDIDLGGRAWTPIGTGTKTFSGHILGNGHTISNFEITSTNPYTGFLGYVVNAEIRDLTLSEFTINGTTYVGGLVGYVCDDGTKISNCHTTNATINGTKYVGGIVGYGSFEEELANCSSNATITATEGFTGGLVGSGSFDMKECAFTGQITSDDSVVGGLAGNFDGGEIASCYSSAVIKGTDIVGGLIGNASSGTIETKNSFTVGKVEATSGTAGGIVGTERNGGVTVSCCYTAAEIIGDSRSGLAPSTSEILCSYYNAEISQLMNDTDSNSDRLTSALTSKDNYDQWDFENVWAIDENISYPYLLAMEKPDSVNVDDLTMQGNGTELNPYIITNREELALMNYHLRGWFKIANDIDLQSEEWIPIGTKDIAFRGNLDGQEHTISNFTLTSEDDYVGFFATTKSVKINNLNMDNFTVTGHDYVGGLIGKSEGSEAYLYNCHLTKATINGHSYVGGIAGSYVGTMRKCTFSGTVNASGDYCGGAAGYASVDSLFDEVETEGTLDTEDDTRSGGITGGGGTTIVDSKTEMVIEDDEPNNDVKPQAPISGEKTSSSSKDNRVPIREGDGSESNPYVIDSFDQINNIKDYPSSNFVLGNDINGNGSVLGGFGTKDAPFRGTFDGGNYKIRNVRIPGSIFRYTNGATIKNVTVQNVWVNPEVDTDPTSVFVAENGENTITFIDCHITDTTLNAKSFVGSLVGGSDGKVIIIDCSSNATINADGSYIGGLVGNANAEITRSQFEGGIYATGDYIGGLVGYAAGGSYEESYSSATLNGHDYVGGLVGTKSNGTLTILNSYATGVFTGNTYIGGIIGHSIGTSSFQNVYAAAEMEGSEHVGGIEGDNENITVTSCYYDMIVSKLDDTTTWGRVTADMLNKSNYVNWNFDDIWHMTEGETYPYLVKVEVPQDVRVNTVSGRIIDSNSSEAIEAVTINVRVGENNKTGEIIKTVCSDTDGKFTLINVNYNTFSLEIIADGYVTQYETITCNSEQEDIGDIGLMNIVSDNAIRARLTWGNEPSNLDVHINGGGQHIFYALDSGTGTGVSIDKSDEDGYGPEIATFECDELPQGTYLYYVQWYEGDGTWSTSNAKVDIYRGNELIYTVTPPESISDNTYDWKVFELDSQTGQITLLYDDENEDIDWTDTTDSDNDGIPDVYENNVHHTDPKNADTDGDGLPDGYEVMTLNTDPNTKDSDDNGVTDDLEDADSDGLTNLEEYNLNTDPFNEDTDDDELSDGDEVHNYGTDPLKEDTDGDNVTDADEIKLGLDPNDSTDGDTIIRQTLSGDQIDLNEDNDDYQLSIDVEASNSIESYMIREISTYQGMLSDNKAIIGLPVYIAYEAGEITDGTISFELNDSLLTERTHYFPELNLGIERYGIFYYDNEVNTIVPVPCSYSNNNTIEVDVKYMGDLMIVDYEALMYDLGVTPGSEEDGEQESNRQVDLVLVIDTTSSMGNEIETVKSNLSTLIANLRQEGISLYVSVVDYCDILSEGTDSTKVNNNSGVDFYNAAEDISTSINSLAIRGGSSECAVDGLGKAYNLDYRNSSAKYIFLITDEEYVNDNTCGLTDLNDVAQKLQSKGVISSVITLSSLYSVYSDLTSLTGGEDILISDDFCDDMYQVILNKTPTSSVLLANNLVSGYFKESLTYGSICDTDGDTLTDSDEIDWTNVKELYEDGTYDMYTWGELCEKSKIAGITTSNGTVNALFSSLNNVYVLPGISSPFSTDTDKDYYPDNVDEHPLERDEMEIDDEELDDSHLYDEEDEEEEIEDEEDIIEAEEYDIANGITAELSAVTSSGKYTDGSIKRYYKDKKVISQEFSRGKNYYATFNLKPTAKSYYRVEVEPSSQVKVTITYKKGLIFKKVKKVTQREDGSYLLSKGVTYTIKVLCKKLDDYTINVYQDNWAYAPNGGIAHTNALLNLANTPNAYGNYINNYQKTYYTQELIQKMTSGADWDNYEQNPQVKIAALYLLEYDYFLNEEDETEYRKQIKSISGLISTIVTYAGMALLFVPGAGTTVDIIGYAVTVAGGGATTVNLLCPDTANTASRVQFRKTLKNATKNDNYNLCLTQYTTLSFGQATAETMKWSSWNSGYIYKFEKETRTELEIETDISMVDISNYIK